MRELRKFRFVYCDPFKCVGCSICEYVCSLKYARCLDPMASRIKAVRIYPSRNIALACVLCENPPCVKICPRNALTQDEQGVIRVDADSCVGCGLCIEACPLGVINLHPRLRIPVVCDLCDGSPLCIEACPEDALTLTTKDLQAQIKRLKAAKQLTG